MEIEDRLGTEGLYSYCMLQSLYIGVLAPLCISMWGPMVSVVYTAIYTKSYQWDIDMSSLVITSSSESLYYLGLPRILNFLFSIQVDIAIILSWEWFSQPGYTQCVWNPVLFACSGWLKYRRLVLAWHRIIRAAMPRMISSGYWTSTSRQRFRQLGPGKASVLSWNCSVIVRLKSSSRSIGAILVGFL